MRRQYTFDIPGSMYHLDISHAHKNVISGGDPGRIRKVASYFDKIESEHENRGLVTVHGMYKGIPITAFSTGMGAASVSITLPEIIEACDDDDMTIVRIGTSGALQKYLNIGDFVATTSVDVAESASQKIMGSGFHATSDFAIRRELVAAAKQHKHDFQQVYEGTTRVTDDIYFDGVVSKTGAHSKSGVLAVSMEFSVYAALRTRYNQDQERTIEVGNLLTISDNLVAEQEHVDMTEFNSRKGLIEDAHIRAGLDALVARRAQRDSKGN